jgi:mono/diheme cytochrome c family protein
VDVGASASRSEAAWGGGLGSLVSSIADAVEVGVAMLSVLVAAGGEGADHGAAPTGDAKRADEGRRVFAAMGCGSCHRLAAAGSTGRIGPDLDERLAGHGRASLIRSIVDAPDRGLSAMPADYRERMTDAELDALVSFLLASR